MICYKHVLMRTANSLTEAQLNGFFWRAFAQANTNNLLRNSPESLAYVAASLADALTGQKNSTQPDPSRQVCRDVWCPGEHVSASSSRAWRLGKHPNNLRSMPVRGLDTPPNLT
jgi:hypothetical protein